MHDRARSGPGLFPMKPSAVVFRLVSGGALNALQKIRPPSLAEWEASGPGGPLGLRANCEVSVDR